MACWMKCHVKLKKYIITWMSFSCLKFEYVSITSVVLWEVIYSVICNKFFYKLSNTVYRSFNRMLDISLAFTEIWMRVTCMRKCSLKDVILIRRQIWIITYVRVYISYSSIISLLYLFPTHYVRYFSGISWCSKGFCDLLRSIKYIGLG